MEIISYFSILINQKMKKNKTTVKLLILTTSIFLVSCGGESSTSDDMTIIDTTALETDESFEDLFESDELDYYLPSPLQVASIFKKSGLAYNSDATHKPEMASKYTTPL